MKKIILIAALIPTLLYGRGPSENGHCREEVVKACQETFTQKAHNAAEEMDKFAVKF